MALENTAKTAGIGAASALGGSMFLGPVLGPVAGGFAADKLSGGGKRYTKVGAGIAVFSLLGGAGVAGSGGNRGAM